jgi:hypothetical protein
MPKHRIENSKENITSSYTATNGHHVQHIKEEKP